jgi:glucoamylase
MRTPLRRHPLRKFGAVATLSGLCLWPSVTLAPAPSASGSPPTLEQAFNNIGITSSSGATVGNYDGIGDSFSASALAADALVPGGTLLHDGMQLTWPDVAPDAEDNLVAAGQTVALSGRGSALGIVGASANGPASGNFVVNYSDGTSTTADVLLSDWVDEQPASGSDFLATTPGWDPGGDVPVSLSYAAVPIDPAETVVSVTVPTVNASVGAGVNTMHIFDLTIGTPAAQAAGAPGAASYYDEARKDCVGTAADTASKVWYTVADGTLSDTYAPTIDNTDVKSLDPIVTGPGFVALQPRDMTYTVSELGTTGMACRVVALDSSEDFAVVTDFVTDPTTEAVVTQVSLVTLPGAPSGLSVYLRFNPLLNGHGGGGADNAGGESATTVQTSRGPVPLSYSTNSMTEAVNRSYATPIYAALAASNPFAAVENGFEGASSDGLNELDSTGTLSSGPTEADNGNVVQTVKLSFSPVGLGRGFVPAPPYLPWPPSQLGTYTTGQAPFSACGPSGGPAAWALPSDGASEVTPQGIAASVATAAGLRALSPSAVSTQTVAIGFGESEQAALGTALWSSTVPFATTFEMYQQQWTAYDSGLCQPTSGSFGHTPVSYGSEAGKVDDAYWLSANVIKASEDKTFLGATAAGLASPWGQSVPAGTFGTDDLAPYFGSYREIFPRDAYETFTGFLADGDLQTARQMVYYFFDNMQLANGSFPRNGLLNGLAAPDTGGLQLDETADPVLMAYEAGLSGDAALYQDHIKPAADFLVANGPADGVERWEEQGGFSPSTMADEVAGLVAAADIARVQGDTASARLFLATADDFRQLVLATTVTTNGPLSAAPYFIRVDKTGNPNDDAEYTLNNGNNTEVDQRTVIDQGFLELARLGELPASSPLITNSLAVAAKSIDVVTPSGTGVMRYNGDGYGDCEAGTVYDPVNNTTSTCDLTGEPWATTDTGTGHPWPVLSGENGEYQVLASNTSAADADLDFMLNSASGIGLVPEQVWDYPNVPASPYGSDPTTASIGFVDGQADGSAAPLTWAQSQLLRLIRDMGTGQLLDQPSIVANRYLNAPPAVAPLTATASTLQVNGGDVPVDLARPYVSVDSSSPGVTVSGNQVGLTVTATTVPEAIVDIAVTGTPLGATTPTTTVTTVTADGDGNASAVEDLDPGTNAIEVATTAPGATNEAIFDVDNLIVPGTVVLKVPGAPGGGYGPGTYAYPTATNSPGVPTFPPGAFQLNGLTVIDSRSAGSSTVTFQIGIANLVPTFGSADGAQLVNLYIHAPSASTTEFQSTAAAAPWNYSIAPTDAWNQLIQVDGFGTDDWVTPSSTTAQLGQSSSIGTPLVSVAQLGELPDGYTPGVITLTVPAATLGAPSGCTTTSCSASLWDGWFFTVALAGQDGFGYYNAREFTATPQAYTFGVCSAAVAAEPSPPAVCSLGDVTYPWDTSLVSDVPYVTDTIPPTGVNVQTELDPTQNPGGVTLQGVGPSDL